MVMGPIISQRTLNMTLFSDHCALNCVFTGESVFPLIGLSFQFNFVKANLCLAYCKYFLSKACFTMHITYSFLSFTWFALLSHKTLDDRPLFKPRVILNKNIFLLKLK